MRAMGVDLLPEGPLGTEPIAEGRAMAWVAGGAVIRARFLDAAASVVSHDLELLVGPGEIGHEDRRRLLLISSREADVHTFADRLYRDGWRELARSRPGRAAGSGYFLALVDHPSRD